MDPGPSVRVVLPPGSEGKETIQNIKGLTVKNTILELKKQNNSLKDTCYFLYYPGSALRKWIWPLDRKMDDFSFPEGAVLELKKRYHIIKVTLIVGPTRHTQLLLIDLHTPLSDFIRFACKKFQLEEHLDYAVNIRGNFLPSGKTLPELDIPLNSPFELISRSGDKTTSHGHIHRSEKGPAGYLHVKSPKKKLGSRYLELKDGVLQVYKAEGDVLLFDLVLSEYELIKKNKKEGEKKGEKKEKKDEKKEVNTEKREKKVEGEKKEEKKDGEKKEKKEEKKEGEKKEKKEEKKDGEKKEKKEEKKTGEKKTEEKKKKDTLSIILKNTKTKETFTLKSEIPTRDIIWVEAITHHVANRAAIQHQKYTQNKDRNNSKEEQPKPETAIFGVPVEKTVKPGEMIPALVIQCCEVVNTTALDIEGIFRKSGSALQIDLYREQFDNNIPVDLSNEDDPHTVTGLLKLFFREMPEPLMTHNLYFMFVEAQNLPDIHRRKRLLRKLVLMLPTVNFHILKYLIKFLVVVDEHSGANKMSMHNLATVFAPNLIRPPSGDVFAMVQDTPAINGLVVSMLLYFEYIFVDFLVAEALYDYDTQAEDQICLKKGDLIMMKEEGDPQGWWMGELQDHPEKKGKFPGSFVKITYPSPGGKHHKELQNLQEQLKSTQKLIEDMKEAKLGLAEDINYLNNLKNSEKTSEDPLMKFQRKISGIFQDNPELSGFGKKLEETYSQLEGSFKTRHRSQQSKQIFVQQLQQLKKTIHTDPRYKKFRGEKLGDLIDELLENIGEEDRYHALMDEKKELILKYLTKFRGLSKFVPNE